MPVSEVQVCNLALSSIGGGAQIGSLEDPTAEARKCRQWFGPTLNEFLRDIEWQSVSKHKNLSPLPDAPSNGWGHQYLYPADALRINRVYSTTASGEIVLSPRLDYEIGRTASNQLVIYCNLADGIGIEYTAKASVELLTDGEAMAFQFLLASRLARAIRNDENKAQALYLEYQRALADAMGENATERGVQRLSGEYWNRGRTDPLF